uniref:KIB1-4 beta-propeller domain-containing protein n=1 Tax=Chenopodium quinoa TaxID=63459 RepID=A0A803MRH7_CHEQI
MDSINFTKMSRGRVFWSDLPPELLSKIAACLESRSDTQNFRAVSTCAGSWLDDSGPFSPVLVASYVLLFQSTIDPKLPPWFFTAEELHLGKLFVSRLLSPIAIRLLPFGFPRNLDLSYIQVCEMAVFHRLRFVDAPGDMFGKKGLPDFNDKRVVLFVNPNCSKTYPTIGDCTAIVLHHRGALCAIRLKDKQELDVSFQGTFLEVRNFHDVINFKEKIYAIDRRGRAYKMDYDTLSLLLFIENPLPEFSTKIRRLAVSTDNQELYLIYRWCKRGTRDGIAFTIYKLNEGETKWDEVEGIGDDKILFVTFDGSFFASAEDF